MRRAEWRAFWASLPPPWPRLLPILVLSGLMWFSAFLLGPVYALFGRWGLLGWAVVYFTLAALAFLRLRPILKDIRHLDSGE